MNQITDIRTRLGLTQVQFAALLGVHPVTVSRWERDFARLPPYNTQQVAAIEKGLRARFDAKTFDRLVRESRFVEALAVIITPGLELT